jgi:hypothetical protein
MRRPLALLFVVLTQQNLRMRRFLLSLVFIAAVSRCFAFSTAEARAELAGRWKGKLEYLDYSSNKWFALPQERTIEVLEGGHTLLETGRFDDGPTGIVYIHSVSAFDKDGTTLRAVSFRKGRDMTSMAESVTFGPGENTPGKWTLVFVSDATDDDRPARLRTTLVFSGTSYTTLKEVDFLDDATETWLVRNRTSLERVP